MYNELEMVDFGYVQTTDLEMIKARIFGTTTEKADPFRFRAVRMTIVYHHDA